MYASVRECTADACMHMDCPFVRVFIISRNQAGFRKNHSTNDHLVRLESFIHDAFVKKEHCVAIFFTLKRQTIRHGNMAS